MANPLVEGLAEVFIEAFFAVFEKHPKIALAMLMIFLVGLGLVIWWYSGGELWWYTAGPGA